MTFPRPADLALRGRGRVEVTRRSARSALPTVLTSSSRRARWRRAKALRLGCALLGATAAWLVGSPLLPHEAQTGAPVVVLARDLAIGSTLSADDVRVERRPLDQRPTHALDRAEAAIGRVAAGPLSEGEDPHGCPLPGPGTAGGAGLRKGCGQRAPRRVGPAPRSPPGRPSRGARRRDRPDGRLTCAGAVRRTAGRGCPRTRRGRDRPRRPGAHRRGGQSRRGDDHGPDRASRFRPRPPWALTEVETSGAPRPQPLAAATTTAPPWSRGSSPSLRSRPAGRPPPSQRRPSRVPFSITFTTSSQQSAVLDRLGLQAIRNLVLAGGHRPDGTEVTLRRCLHAQPSAISRKRVQKSSLPLLFLYQGYPVPLLPGVSNWHWAWGNGGNEHVDGLRSPAVLRAARPKEGVSGALGQVSRLR